MYPRVWWCNQSKCWAVERRAELIIASGKAKRLYHRQRVGEVMAGDITLHYVRGKIVAVSRAITNGVESKKLPEIGPKSYGFGWSFKADYFEFDRKIPREHFINRVLELFGREERQTNFAVSKKGRILQGYFLVFSLTGLEAIKQDSKTNWPTWVP
jgi:hypothetical protein